MRLVIYEVRQVNMSQAGKRRLTKAEREGLCLACMEPLGDEKGTRGCHSKCYRATLRAIERGLTTEAERVQQGKLAEPMSPGRKPSNPVTTELS